MIDRELALLLLDRLIDLELERIAMANLLNFARVPESGLPLEWRPMVQASHDQMLRDIVSGKYAETRRAILDSTTDCPNALSLLESVLTGLAPIDDL
jgi:hypothetical protein